MSQQKYKIFRGMCEISSTSVFVLFLQCVHNVSIGVLELIDSCFDTFVSMIDRGHLTSHTNTDTHYVCECVSVCVCLYESTGSSNLF